MNGETKPQAARLEAGLYLVSTPIGAARDITLRALDVLASADVLAAEDTRTLRHLMDIHGIALGARPIVAYHDHNGDRARPRLLAALAEGKSVAYASEAGTPLLADPGYDLSRAATAAGHRVLAVPGASALLAALAVAGLPTDRFLFAGFPPAAAAARRTWLAEFRSLPATLVFYESPGRLRETLAALAETFGPGRRAAVARELTKRFEEVSRGTLSELSAEFSAREARGEFVILIDRAPPVGATAEEVRSLLTSALVNMSVKDAAHAVSDATGLPRREVYQMALKLGKPG